MASLIVRKLDATVVVLDDLGLSITGPGTTTFDLYAEQANDISDSNDLIAAINGSALIVGQDETNFPGGGSPNGDFVGGDGVGGTAYVALDTISLSDGSVIRVDSVDGNDDVLTFTIIDASGIVTAGVALTQVATSGTGTSFTLTPESNNQSAATLEVLDPRDNTTLLSTADGLLVVRNHNLPHFGIEGGRFSGLDAPGASPTNDFILEYDSGSDTYIQVDPAEVIAGNSDTVSGIVGGMIEDGSDTNITYDPSSMPILQGQDETDYDNVSPNGTFNGVASAGSYVIADVITMSDGSTITVDNVAAGDVTEFTVTTNGSNATPGVAITQTSVAPDTGQTGYTLTPENPNIQQGSIQVNVDDSYLRNDGDTLDSGTLTVASGATIAVATGASLTIADAPTNPTDATNKAYVDSLSAGLDPKESVRYGTVSDPGGTYAAGGGTNGTGAYTAIDLTASGPFDGLTGGAIAIGDRILIKDAGAALENGIYVVTTAGAAGAMERATDQDGVSPAGEVSGGNFTFVEEGTTLNGTGWVVVWDGDLVLNTDPMNWTQFSTSTTLVAGLGISQGGQDFDLDIDDLPVGAAAVVGADLVAFHDQNGAAAGSGSGAQSYSRTWTQLLADLDIVNGVAGTGFVVQTAADTHVARSIAVEGAGDGDGLIIANGDGVSGNPTIGLDIEGLPARSTAVDTTDRVAVWRADGTDANEYYTISEIAGAVGASDSFNTWARSGNGSGASVVADSSADTVTLDGGIGIDLTFTPASDTVSFAFTDSGMADTAVVGADTVPFFDSGNSFEPEFRSWTNIISDLGLVTSLAAATGEDLLGIDVTGSTIGFTIDTLTNPAEDMAATDEFAVHNKSEGTAGANRKMTGQEIADGTATILNITGVTLSTINSQTVLTFIDSTRSNKVLSTDSVSYFYGENSLGHLDWMQVGNATDSDSGHIMPLDGTVVFFTAHCENTFGNSKDMHLYIDGADQGSLGTLSGGANAEIVNTTVNLNFSQGQKLRVQAQGAGSSSINDTVVDVHVRWRA